MAKSLPLSEKQAIAAAILRLMMKLGRKQVAFAELMNVKQSVVSEWLAGRKRPSGEHLIRLGQLAEGAERVLFWEAAGHETWEIDDGRRGARQREMAPLAEARGEARPEEWPRTSNSVELVLLKDAAAAGPPRQIDVREIERVIAMPRMMVAHPEQTVCVKAIGDSMYPVLDDGYICLVDTSQREMPRLVNRMVLARDPEGGATIKWLRRHKEYMLVPQHTVPENPVILLEKEEGWSILGEVVRWIGEPRRRKR